MDDQLFKLQGALTEVPLQFHPSTTSVKDAFCTGFWVAVKIEALKEGKAYFWQHKETSAIEGPTLFLAHPTWAASASIFSERTWCACENSRNGNGKPILLLDFEYFLCTDQRHGATNSTPVRAPMQVMCCHHTNDLGILGSSTCRKEIGTIQSTRLMESPAFCSTCWVAARYSLVHLSKTLNLAIQCPGLMNILTQ